MSPRPQQKSLFFINPQQRAQNNQSLAQEASQIFSDFIKDKDYGKAIRVFWFFIHVEANINFGRQEDYIYDKLAQLSCHIDKESFDSCSYDAKLKLLLNAALILIKHFAQVLPVPKGYQAEELAADFEDHLAKNKFSLSTEQIEKAIIKPFITTRFNFIVTTTSEVKKDSIHYDLKEIQDFINTKISGQSFSGSVRAIDLGYEIADSTGRIPHFPETAGIKRYQTKDKRLLVVKQFDYNVLKDLSAKEQFDLLSQKILEAISELDQIKRKPKDFETDRFLATIKNTLIEYRQKYLT